MDASYPSRHRYCLLIACGVVPKSVPDNPSSHHAVDQLCRLGELSRFVARWQASGLLLERREAMTIADVYVKLIGEDSLFRLTNSAMEESHPAWSPDGRRYCPSPCPRGDFEVVVVPALSGIERKAVPAASMLLGADRLSLVSRQ